MKEGYIEEGTPILDGQDITDVYTHGGQFNDNTIVVDTVANGRFRIKVKDLIGVISELNYEILPKKRKDQINTYLKPILPINPPEYINEN